MQTYSLKVTMQDEDGTSSETFKDLLEGDLEIMKSTSRMLAPTGTTVTLEVERER